MTTDLEDRDRQFYIQILMSKGLSRIEAHVIYLIFLEYAFPNHGHWNNNT